MSSPEFKRTMVDVIVPIGSSTKFLVEFRNPGGSPLNVHWYHTPSSSSSSLVKHKVKGTSRHVILQDKDIYCLQIHNVKLEDEGEWLCIATDGTGGECSCSAQLGLNIPEGSVPPRFSRRGLYGFLWEDGTISLQCDVLGVPTPILRWYRNGSPLSAGNSLTIKAFSRESKSCLGIFCCEASNCMGSEVVYARVYARNFSNFLKACGHLGVIREVSSGGGEVTKKGCGEKKKKKLFRNSTSDTEEDSGIC